MTEIRPEHYTLRQLCETAGCSTRTAYRLLERSQLKATLAPNGRQGQYQITHEDWDDFFNRRDQDRVRLRKPNLRCPVQPWTQVLVRQCEAVNAGL